MTNQDAKFLKMLKIAVEDDFPAMERNSWRSKGADLRIPPPPLQPGALADAAEWDLAAGETPEQSIIDMLESSAKSANYWRGQWYALNEIADRRIRGALAFGTCGGIIVSALIVAAWLWWTA